MVKFCPECGHKLEKKYKFCSECGFDLVNIDNSKNQENSSLFHGVDEKRNSTKVIICEICGEENASENAVCSGCGAKLKNERSERSSSGKKKESGGIAQSQKTQKKSIKQTNKTNPDKKSLTEYTANKKLNKIRVITVVSIGLGIALIILIFSGELNSLIIPNNEIDITQNQNPSSGVNLNNIQKINDLEVKVKSNPPDKASILELAHLKNDSGLYEQAIINYKQYLVLEPTDPDARIDMGICYYNLQNYDIAIKEMEQAIKYDPKHQIGYLDLGIVNLAAGNLEKSNDWLKKAVNLDPNSEYGKKAEELLKSHNSVNKTNGGK